jgi:hypothetical protein
MKKLRRVSHDEVIAEFLKNEFHEEEFHRDRKQFQHLVMQADLANATENAVRRALLFRRRGHMWRELPADTQWWEVAIEPSDLQRIYVFPRAQWRRVSHGSFQLEEIVDRIRERHLSGKTDEFLSKIQALSYRLRFEGDNSSLMLIGVDDDSALTIIEGNHRSAAAMLASPTVFQNRFRVFCGLSADMTQSCWYRTSVPNLWRYARNRFKHLLYDPEVDLARALEAKAVLVTTPAKCSAEAASGGSPVVQNQVLPNQVIQSGAIPKQ